MIVTTTVILAGWLLWRRWVLRHQEEPDVYFDPILGVHEFFPAPHELAMPGAPAEDRQDVIINVEEPDIFYDAPLAPEEVEERPATPVLGEVQEEHPDQPEATPPPPSPEQPPMVRKRCRRNELQLLTEKHPVDWERTRLRSQDDTSVRKLH